LAEEKRIRGLLTELKLTLVSGNDLLISTNAILDRLNFGQCEVGATEPSTPYDIKDYQATLHEASRAMAMLHELVKTIDRVNRDAIAKLLLPVYSSCIHQLSCGPQH